MLDRDQLEKILNEVWDVFKTNDLSMLDTAQVWDALGEFIFSDEGKLERKSAVARMLVYIDDKYRQEK